MKLLLDENLPRKLKDLITGHEVFTVSEMKWSGKKNGELLALLDQNGIDILITADKNLHLQQSVRKHKVAVILLRAHDNRLRTLKELVPEVLQKIEFLTSGQFIEICQEKKSES
jgi:predicted nuclease of predicted toxin-antitoxin system